MAKLSGQCAIKRQFENDISQSKMSVPSSIPFKLYPAGIACPNLAGLILQFNHNQPKQQCNLQEIVNFCDRNQNSLRFLTLGFRKKPRDTPDANHRVVVFTYNLLKEMWEPWI